MGGENLWLIKDRKGRIQGPFSAKEVEAQIEEGRFQGGELFSPYPLGRWRPLSAHPGFYEKILSRLSAPPGSGEGRKPGAAAFAPGEEEEAAEPTVVIPQDPQRASQKKAPAGAEKKRKKVRISFERPEEKSEIIEMERNTAAARTGILGQRRGPLKILLALVALAAASPFFLAEKKSGRNDQIRLAGPGSGAGPAPALTKDQARRKMKKAVAHYMEDTVPGYLKAQALLSQILEGRPGFKPGYSYLCLAHLELWPFSHQDTRDRRVMAAALNRISKIDRGGVYAGLCSAVSALIKNQQGKALLIINSSLNALGSSPPGFFYYLKARALSKTKKKKEAKLYLKEVYKELPKWIAPRMLEAGLYYEDGRFALAAEKYRLAASIAPNHKAAALRLAALEYRQGKSAAKSEKRLRPILNSLSELIDPRILSEAHEAMAQILRRLNEKGEALKHAKKAYALDPGSASISSLVSSLGGKAAAAGGERLKTRQMIYRGDILAGQRRCRKAREYFKKAWEADGRRNALAAVKMAKCLRREGSAGQAVSWLRRATAADPMMAEAYFLLADYLSEQYNFEAARKALKAAERSRPSRYEILKSHALLAFRRKIYSHAVSYAEQAAKAYSADPEIHALLHDAHHAMGNGAAAFKAAERAVAEDVNSVPGQIAYARALGSAYGFGRGESYFKKLTREFPRILEYRQAYGEYFFDHEKYDGAREIFERLSSLRPNFKPAHVYLGRIYGFFGRRDRDEAQFQEGLEHLLKASLLDVSDPEPLFYRGWIYMQAERFRSAEDQFEKVLQLNPNYPQISYYIGMANFLQGGGENLDRALSGAKAEIQKNPRFSKALVLAGDVYRKKAEGAFDDLYRKRANYEMCAREYQKSLRLVKGDSDLYVKLIGCYRGAGDFDSAIQIANEIIENGEAAGNPEIYRQLGSIHEAKGDYEKAPSVYRIYFSLRPNAEDRREIESRLKSYAAKGGKKPKAPPAL